MALLGSKQIESSMWTKILIFGIVLTTLFLTLMSLYLGANYQPEAYLMNLNIYVVDFDQGVIGQSLLNLTYGEISNSSYPSPDWTVYSPVNFEYNPDLVRSSVENGNVWAAIVVNPGASNNLSLATNNADPNYNPHHIISVFYDESRDPQTVHNHIKPSITHLLRRFNEHFSQNWTQQVALNNVNNTLVNVANKAPKILTGPALWTDFNLSAMQPSPIVAPALTFGLLLVLIFTFAAVTIIVDVTDEQADHLSPFSFLSLRMRMTMLYTFVLALLFACLLAGFQCKFNGFLAWLLFFLIQWLHLTVHALTFLIAAIVATPGKSKVMFSTFE